MKKCKHCGKAVNERHYCESQQRVVESDSPSLLGGLLEVVGDVLDSAVDNLDFD